MGIKMSNHDFDIVNCDTDSIMFCKADQSKFSEEEMEALLNEVNDLFPEKIKFANDGYFSNVVIIKAKNYILQSFKDKKIKIKGSALKASMKEKALQTFINDVIEVLLKDKKDRIFAIYNKYAKMITQITDITDWCTKKTITKAVLNPERTNEQKVADIIEDEEYIQEGDKIYTYFKKDKSLGLRDNFGGDYCEETLLDKLYKTLKIFNTVLDIDLIPNYKLARNKDLLDNIKNS
jgi:DNA polymerase elongation subunit (family B)